MRRKKIIRVRVDEGLYDFIVDQMQRNNFKTVSETVRFLLQIMRFLNEYALLPHDSDTLEKWVHFLRTVEKRFNSRARNLH